MPEPPIEVGHIVSVKHREDWGSCLVIDVTRPEQEQLKGSLKGIAIIQDASGGSHTVRREYLTILEGVRR